MPEWRRRSWLVGPSPARPEMRMSRRGIARSEALHRARNIGARGGAPEPLEIVIKPRAFAENVHDQAAEIEQHPVGACFAFAMLRADAAAVPGVLRSRR